MNQFDKNTCWYKGAETVAEMLRAYDQSQPGYHLMEHIIALKKLIALLPQNQIVIDLGCGTAQVSQLFKKHKYFGADLDFIIDGCARTKHPEHSYIPFDAEESNYFALNAANIVLMNGFIDVMQFPLQILENVFEQDPDHILLHRQEFCEVGETRTTKMPSYGGETFHSIISEADFSRLLTYFNYAVIKSYPCGFSNWENGGTTMLISKNV